MSQVCIYCLRDESRVEPFCPTNPGKGCTYGGPHEYPLVVDTLKVPVMKKLDKKLCTKCGVHQKNPLAVTNGCSHEFPA